VRLDPPPRERAAGAIGFGELVVSLEPRRVIPVALELDDGTVILNPEPERAFDLQGIRAVYALAETRDLGG
jgi:hypothetical protein